MILGLFSPGSKQSEKKQKNKAVAQSEPCFSIADSVTIGKETYAVRFEHSRNRNASARLRDGAITISIPSRWPKSERERVARNLLSRSIKSIELGKWNPEQEKRVSFHDGQHLTAMGQEFDISMKEGKRFRAKTKMNRIEISFADHPKKDEKISSLVRREITKAIDSHLKKRVHELNEQHFQAPIRKIAIRDSISRWGSCSRDSSISLNFRLLFMPDEILDYVIIHELAHTRYRGHGPRFWALVERAIPNHKERRAWLKKNGWRYPEKGAVKAPEQETQETLIEFLHEPDETDSY